MCIYIYTHIYIYIYIWVSVRISMRVLYGELYVQSAGRKNSLRARGASGSD